MTSINNTLWLLLIKIVLVNTIPLGPGILHSLQSLNYPRNECFAPETISFTIQDSTSNIGPYVQELSNNNQLTSNCPCAQEVPNNLNQLLNDNIFNNPTLQRLIKPQIQHEVRIPREISNNCPASSPPCVTNNYIIIPPEAFKDKPKYIDKRYSEPKKRKSRKRKNENTVNQQRCKPKHSKKKSEKTVKTNREKKQNKGKNQNNPAVKLQIRPNNACCNCQGHQLNDCPKKENNLSSFCDVLDILKEFKCCPENRCARNIIRDTRLINELTPQAPPEPERPKPQPKKAQHVNHGSSRPSNFQGLPQMAFPNIAQYYRNPMNFFNYPQMFGFPDNSKAIQTQKTNSIKNKKNRPTVILKVKIDNGNNTDDKQNITSGDQKEIYLNKNDSKELHDDKLITTNNNNKQPQIQENNNIEDTTTSTTAYPSTEMVTEITKKHTDAVTSTTLKPIINETVNLIELIEKKSESIEIKNTTNKPESKGIGHTTVKLSDKRSQNISTPELGSEDELPNIEFNDLMEDYYPDFQNEDHSYSRSKEELSDKTESKNLDNHEKQNDSNTLAKNRHFYKIQEDNKSESMDVETITVPESVITTTSVKTLDDTIITTTQKSKSEKLTFITPPTLTHIDFETKQITNKNSESKGDSFIRAAHSVAKTPKYSVQLKPFEELKLTVVPKDYERNENIETVFVNSKVVNYGKNQDSTEDTVERPIEDISIETDSKYTSDGPFLVIAKSIGNEDELW